MARPNIVLETLVWRLVWLGNGGRASQRDLRVEYVAEVAKPLLQACLSLRQMFYTEANGMIDHVRGKRFALMNNGELDVQSRTEADIPSWKEI